MTKKLNNLVYNNKEYNFLNHYILDVEKNNQLLSFAVHDSTIISVTPKILKDNQFIDKWDHDFSMNEINKHLQDFQNGVIKINHSKTALYNLQLLKEQKEKTIILDNVFQQCLIIDETRYLLIEEEYGFHFVKEVGEKVVDIDDENEFLHILSYFFPILLREQANSIVFDGFDLSIIEFNETTFLVYNHNQNFYVLREEESLIENDKYAFRYVDIHGLTKKEQKQIQNLIKKEYDKK